MCQTAEGQFNKTTKELCINETACYQVNTTVMRKNFETFQDKSIWPKYLLSSVYIYDNCKTLEGLSSMLNITKLLSHLTQIEPVEYHWECESQKKLLRVHDSLIPEPLRFAKSRWEFQARSQLLKEWITPSHRQVAIFQTKCICNWYIFIPWIVICSLNNWEP